jgi:hypothetical protein
MLFARPTDSSGITVFGVHRVEYMYDRLRCLRSCNAPCLAQSKHRDMTLEAFRSTWQALVVEMGDALMADATASTVSEKAEVGIFE